LTGPCLDLVDIHPGNKNVSQDFKLLLIGSYFSQQAYHYLFYHHGVVIQQTTAVSNPTTSNTSCCVLEWLSLEFGLVIGFIEHLYTTCHYKDWFIHSKSSL
jgi:hypothetical protein